MKILPAIVLVAVFPSASFSEVNSDSVLPEASFEVDLSNLRSVDELEVMTENARTAMDSDGCESAEPQFSVISIQANATANILRAGNEPFYGASRDDRDTFGRSSAAMAPLIEAENKMNQALTLRNEAWVGEGICKLESGDVEGGVALLNKALQYIDLRDEPETWKLAREAIWGLVSYPEPKNDKS